MLHEELFASVLADWGMSPAIVEAAREHHRCIGNAKNAPASSLEFAGNLVCQHLGVGAAKRHIDSTVAHVFADLELSEPDTTAAFIEKVSVGVESLLHGLRSG